MDLKINILLGVSASIAIYKSPILIRRLQDRGATVKTIMTENAARLISPQVFEAVTGQLVFINEFDIGRKSAMDHIELKNWGDILLLYPATANTIGRCAHGLADNLLTTLFLAFRKPVFLAPAMNKDMYESPALAANLSLLSERGVQIVEPVTGDLACGEKGIGKLIEPEDFIQVILAHIVAAI